LWEFASDVLERHGLAVVVILATYAGLGIIVRELWVRLHERTTAIETERVAHTKALLLEREERTKAVIAEREARAAMRAEHERELTAMREQLAVEAQRYAQRFDALHERRNEDLREVLRESLDHMAATREAVGKITEAMGTLRDVLRRPA